MKKLILFVVLLLAACHDKPQPIPQPITHDVYCLTPEQYQALVDAMPKQMTEDELTGQAQKDFITSTKHGILVRLYAQGLLKVLGGCIGPAPSDA